MARIADRLNQNAPGDYFVDASCIDCDTCRQVAPDVYLRLDEVGQSVVRRQPETAGERRRAAMALVACPTASIGTSRKDEVGAAAVAFPDPVTGDVHYCGYASEATFGAASYLIVRPGGNVLVDSPRAARPLLDRIAALGGVRTMILTHRDDVADHETFHRTFGCDRVIHRSDVDGGHGRGGDPDRRPRARADRPRPHGDPRARPHPRERRADLPRSLPLQRRSRLVRADPGPAQRLAQRLLVLVDGADPIHGAPRGLRLRVGAARARAAMAGARARHICGRRSRPSPRGCGGRV